MPVIVIIDDDDLMRGLLEAWLSEAGYAVRAASLDAPAAGSADLVIIDLHSPRRAGLETVHAAHQAHPGAPVIAISGRFSPGLTGPCSAARALGVQAVIAKPLSRDDLLGAVRTVIDAPH